MTKHITGRLAKLYSAWRYPGTDDHCSLRGSWMCSCKKVRALLAASVVIVIECQRETCGRFQICKTDMAQKQRLVRFSMMIRRRPNMSEDEFQHYWTEMHGPIVKEWLARHGFIKYTQVSRNSRHPLVIMVVAMQPSQCKPDNASTTLTSKSITRHLRYESSQPASEMNWAASTCSTSTGTLSCSSQALSV